MTDNKKDMRDTYTIYDDQTIGKVQIADEVVAIIAGLAATEVEGVASMAGNITNELVGKLGITVRTILLEQIWTNCSPQKACGLR